jgi:hypothetical protein
MGVDAGDFDGDGDEDIFITHLARETNTLYINDGQGWFEDRTVAMGLANPSFAYTGFGTAWIDDDNDGWLDIFAVNGAVTLIESQVRDGEAHPLRQRNQLFRNLGDGRYREISDEAGPAFEVALVSRGAAFGDIDNDGDTDVVIGNNAGPARVLLNARGQAANWLGLRLVTGEPGRDAYGARVALLREDQPPLWRRVRADGSYASSNDPRVLFGLGRSGSGARAVRVIWPDGTEATYDGLETGRYHTLRQRAGIPGGAESQNQL